MKNEKLEKLKTEIHQIKAELKSANVNVDYRTGYLCALSAVEGMIAEIEGEEEMIDEVITHLKTTRDELLARENEKQSHAFAKGITFSISMINAHLKEVEE